jgi:uncharacterized Zn-binding protein involved in type VI secretion
MAGIARLGDILGPGGVLVGPVSPNVFVNGRPVALFGCTYTPHPCCGAEGCPPTHCFGPTFDVPAGVTVNGLPPITKQGKGICGHGVQTASSDVIIKGGGMGGALGGLASKALA